MKKGFELLGKYLRGEASLQERIRVMEWTRESDANMQEFMAMRRIYDASLMNEDIDMQRAVKKHPDRLVHRFFRTVAAMAAAASIAAGVTYFFMQHDRQESFVAQTFSAPLGQRTEVMLSDGTSVRLNSGSSLEIVSSGKKERRVRLEGEAYLNVSHDAAKPFIVETSQIEVKVLGTTFDVSTYGDRHSVVLVEGSVEVCGIGNRDRIIISPDEMYTFDAATGHGRVKQVDAGGMTAWVDGYLDLRSMTARELFYRLENYYGIEIICPDALDENVTMSGKLMLETRVESVLDNLCRMLSISYSRIDDRTLQVSVKN